MRSPGNWRACPADEVPMAGGAAAALEPSPDRCPIHRNADPDTNMGHRGAPSERARPRARFSGAGSCVISSRHEGRLPRGGGSIVGIIKSSPAGDQPLFFFEKDQSYEQARRLSEQYSSAQPFPHIVIDDFLPVDLIEHILASFPAKED